MSDNEVDLSDIKLTIRWRLMALTRYEIRYLATSCDDIFWQIDIIHISHGLEGDIPEYQPRDDTIAQARYVNLSDIDVDLSDNDVDLSDVK